MIRVVKAPPIRFTCRACKAINEGDVEDFTPLNTMPPSYHAHCAFCDCLNTCFPEALIARAAGAHARRLFG